MQKLLLVAATCALLTACAQQSIPEFSVYEGRQIQIEATATPGLIDSHVQIRINGETIIDDRTEAFGGSSQSFEGTWNGKPVLARATRVTKFASNYTMIDIFIGGTLVETLVV